MSFIVTDTEDNSAELMAAGLDPFKKQVTQIAAMTAEGKRYYSKGNVEDYKRWQRQQPERFIYAHNVQYDLGNLYADFLDELDTTFVGGRVIRAVAGKQQYVDSFNIWPMSVAKLAPAFGLEKLETGSMATDKDYVFRDVEIIHAAMTFAWQFCELLGVETLAPTLGGLCVKIWKHWEGENCHDSMEESRAALFGGRVELFKVLSETGFVGCTDLNSLYPSVMQKPFPGVLEDCETKLPEFGIARCDVHQPETDLPVLPYRDDEGRILYPCGRFQGTWTIAELREFELHGGKILKVHQCYGTNESGTYYKDFTSKLYAMRLGSESPAESLFFKLLMNNLYGRLGTSGVIGRTVYINERNKDSGVRFGKRVLVKYKMPLSEETNWSHAAYVTAYGRLELLRHLRLIGTDRLIYCDTDSAIFDCPAPIFNMQFAEQPRATSKTLNRLTIPFETGKELGQMKVETWGQHCQVWAPKMYCVGDEYKAKGVPKRLAKEFITQGHVEFDLPFKFREAIAFFDRGNAKKLSVWRRIEKHIRSNYDKKRLENNRFYPCTIRKL